MSDSFLGNQDRPAKPRETGLTAMIDPGLPLGAFNDLIHSHHAWIDSVKFGWGTSLVTPQLGEKIAVLGSYKIPFWFGGTLFERAYAEGRMLQFLDFVYRYRAPFIEISDGTIDLPAAEKLKLIRKLSHDFLVLSEVGKKDSGLQPDPRAWQHSIWTELEAGARWVILEGREGGNAGLYDASGTPRQALIEAILSTTISLKDIFLEAPRKDQQTFFIRMLGSQVNLSNIGAADIIGLETLRRGLRSDTFNDLPHSFATHQPNGASHEHLSLGYPQPRP